MTECFVIEKMVVLGVWVIFSNVVYKNEGTAIDKCESIIKYMRKTDKYFTARVTKLLINMD